ncbi:MAG: hypothetical protein MRZ54_01205 [Clostridiales bacterium]|nr:hypothetical protein [Clostridiales bacterium]
MPVLKRFALALSCLIGLMLLSACGMPENLSALLSAPKEASGPDLRLLDWPEVESAPTAVQEPGGEGVLRVDLWLDASQVMGGISPNETGLYPHFSRKYREGGFHYRLGNTVGMYEGVLRGMLAAAEGSRTRILRYGNERLPDDYLAAQGVAGENATASELRSLRRDMLTYAIDPMPTVFSEFSAEDMSGSFYSLGSPAMERVSRLAPEMLENPEKADAMAAAVSAQRSSIEAGGGGALLAVGDDTDYPLLYALDNLDLTRLSVIVCDPAAIRRLSGVSADGTPVDYVQSLLEERGVFDAGLCVGLYAFTLDYMGQMGSFGAADFSEPVLWGKLSYSTKRQAIQGALPMPRTLLCLVVGAPDQVEAYTEALNAQLSASPALRELRGPEKGELVYTQNGETVTQQPFSFAYRYLQIERPTLSCHTQHTAGAVLSCEDGHISTEGSLSTLTLEPADGGVPPDCTLTLMLPQSSLPGGLDKALDSLVDSGASVQAALLLTQELPITGDTPANGQALPLRDKLYVFTREDAAFQSGEAPNPFRLTGLRQNGGALEAEVSVSGSLLRPGYYRVLLTASLPGNQLGWENAPWVDELNVTLTNEQISEWESFTQLITQYDRDTPSVPRQFQHAWGAATDSAYHGMPIPDFPPVMRAPGLSELVSQLRAAATVDSLPLIRYVFDVFVTGS